MSAVADTLQRLRDNLSGIIKGRDETIDLLITALIANGHVLIEDYPGSGKTTLAKAIGASIDCGDESLEAIVDFRRIQFTPDLLPSDVLGVNVFEPNSGTFSFQHGPVFAHIVLADEINRTGPKVQSAFLECMAERQVTVDNTTHQLDDLFFVIGTQNPRDLAGTYPLPLVQLDRFLLKIPMRYVDAETELDILKRSEEIQTLSRHASHVVTRQEVLEAREASKLIHVADSILETIVAIVQDSRQNPQLKHGASTRAAIMCKEALQAFALLKGSDFVSDYDLKQLAPYVFKHRLLFHASAGK